MANVNVTIRMDSELKKEADILFDELGLSLSTAITLFAKQAIREQKIPFAVALSTPNAETVAALNELPLMVKDKKKYKRYDDMDALLGAIN